MGGCGNHTGEGWGLHPRVEGWGGGWHPTRKVLVDPPSVLGVQGGARQFHFCFLELAHVACMCWSLPRTSSVWPVGPVCVSGRPAPASPTALSQPGLPQGMT